MKVLVHMCNYPLSIQSKNLTLQSEIVFKVVVAICLVKYENLPYLYFDSRYGKKTLYILEDIHQQILFAKFHENLGELIYDLSLPLK